MRRLDDLFAQVSYLSWMILKIGHTVLLAILIISAINLVIEFNADSARFFAQKLDQFAYSLFDSVLAGTAIIWGSALFADWLASYDS
ncbi:hypothetical protein FACS1894105_04850 [Clostridia bacterium]|nr:hypothetical protein FACS1894105_04850 [Clostridia bacterium]